MPEALRVDAQVTDMPGRLERQGEMPWPVVVAVAVRVWAAEPACRRLPARGQPEIAVQERVARPIEEQVARERGRRAGGFRGQQSGGHARLQHYLRAIVFSAHALRPTDEARA